MDESTRLKLQHRNRIYIAADISESFSNMSDKEFDETCFLMAVAISDESDQDDRMDAISKLRDRLIKDQNEENEDIFDLDYYNENKYLDNL